MKIVFYSHDDVSESIKWLIEDKSKDSVSIGELENLMTDVVKIIIMTDDYYEYRASSFSFADNAFAVSLEIEKNIPQQAGSVVGNIKLTGWQYLPMVVLAGYDVVFFLDENESLMAKIIDTKKSNETMVEVDTIQ